MVTVVYDKSEHTSKSRVDIERWLQAVALQYSEADAALISRAIEHVRAHCIAPTHLARFDWAVATAHIVFELQLDADTVVAALVYGVLDSREETRTEIIRDMFGDGIAHMAEGVRRMDLIESAAQSDFGEAQAGPNVEGIRKMVLAMAEDVRVVIIKLAERLHALRMVATQSIDQQQRLAEETRNLFAPLANRLGIWQLKWELEDLAFRYLDPETYKRIAQLVNERRADREQYIQRFMAQLQHELERSGIRATVAGRPKHIFSIYRKMQRKNMDYTKLYDIRAVRILVDEVKDCYAALGLVHGLWTIVPTEFDDYIANPKTNDYRSLHTAVIGPEGKTVEVQIRTHTMHQSSELGVAAHWRYKEGARAGDEGFERKIAWLRQVLEWKDELRDSSALLAKLSSDGLDDRVYVFTPKGQVVDLPLGSTPLDFAYHIHTDLGHRCRGAKVNGRMVPLIYALRNGDRVEVLAVKRGDPSRDWLNSQLGYLQSPRARGKVQAWFKSQDVARLETEGRVLLEKELSRLGLKDVNYEKLARQLKFDNADEFLVALGRADVRTGAVLNALQTAVIPPPEQTGPALPPAGKQTETRGGKDDVFVVGVGNLLTHFAHCCNPLPGDALRGYVTRGRGVTVHRDDCLNILRFLERTPERVIEVSWGETRQHNYPVTVEILAFDRQGLLRDITQVLANEQVNVIGAKTQSNARSHIATLRLIIEVPSLDKLSNVLHKLNQVPNVSHVRRAVA